MQKAVEIQSQGLILRGMLHTPDNYRGKIPLCIIFHGFTGNKMEAHFIFVKLSRMLEKCGIASLRFDFAGSGESDGEFVNMTMSGELADAHNILNYAKELDFVDNERIAVMGLSMGGAVASLLAGQRKQDVRALCLWAPAGSMNETFEVRYLGSDKDKINKNGWIDIGGFNVGIGFMHDLNSIDIYQRAAEFDKNVLIIHGENDCTVPLKASERYLDIYGYRSRLYMVKGGDHTFNSSVCEMEVLGETVQFLKNELFK
ncbi:MAG: alpha/beta hydrolase [Bacillota bacterium]|nr:alpha/beta hydrolase [Bacillota bacterium]